MDTRHTSSDRQSTGHPRILLAATNRWSLTARLASGFLNLGCHVAAVCPVTGHPIRKVRGFKHLYPYAAGRSLESLRVAIEEFAPDVIVPVCDRSVELLHQLHAQCAQAGGRGPMLGELIERSLGPASSFSVVSSRYDLMMLAKDAGIRIPDTIRIDSIDDMREWEDRLPWLLKADGTSYGIGVKKAETIISGTKALRKLTTRASVFGLITRLLLYRDRASTIANWAATARPGIVAQAIVRGRPANCSIVCWNGETLAGIAVEVVQADGPHQPAIVVQVVEGREMLEAAGKIASRLGLTGFFGLDFMIEEGTGALYLIEMNPRCTPPCSVNLGGNRDLLAAFWAKLAGQDKPERPATTEESTIAYFPNAVLYHSANLTELDSFYLDAPAGDPELVHELLHPWSEFSLMGGLLHQIRCNLPFKKELRRILSRLRSAKELPHTEVSEVGRSRASVTNQPQSDWR
jgi:hypothetical protein